MKFGKRLEETANHKYYHYYLAYRTLKKAVKMYEESKGENPTLQRITASNGNLSSTSAVEARFMELIEKELSKVNLFSQSKVDEMKGSLVDVARRLQDDPQDLTESDLIEMEKSADEIAADLIFLDNFVQVNLLGFRKIIKKHDKVVHVGVTPWFLARLSKEPFCNIKLDDLLISLSTLYSRIRKIRSGIQEAAGVWVPPQSFARRTTKYWVSLDHVMTVKAKVIKHLPILIFGASAAEQENLLSPYRMPIKGQKELSEAQLITSVYFDNEEAASYHRRIEREEGAQLIRFRWYGENDGKPDKEVFIERKTHHESWVSEDSVKERFSLKQKKVKDYMEGKYTLDHKIVKMRQNKTMKESELANMLKLSHEVQDKLVEEKMRPMVRTTYLRSAFQLANSNDVRISLDTRLSMVNEDVPSRGEKLWCRTMQDAVALSDVVRFPYAILEVKLQTEEPPSWVADLIGNKHVIEVYKFSKFQHGIAYLHGEKVRQLPHWFDEFREKARPVSDEEEAAPPLTGELPAESPKSKIEPMQIEIVDKRLPADEPTYTRPAATSATTRAALTTRSPVGAGSGIMTDRADMRQPLLAGATHSHDARTVTQKPSSGTGSSTRTCFGFKIGGSGRKNSRVGAGGAADNKPVKKAMVKVEPKTFFANERTLLQWLNTSVLLSTISVTLMNFGERNSRICGMILSPVAIFFILYSCFVWYTRASAIARREAIRYDDRLGPIILVIFLLVAMTSIITFNLVADPLW